MARASVAPKAKPAAKPAASKPASTAKDNTRQKAHADYLAKLEGQRKKGKA